MNDPYANVAAAVIIQAAKDARRSQIGATTWLKTTGYEWLNLMFPEIDIDRGVYAVWVELKCPGLVFTGVKPRGE